MIRRQKMLILGVLLVLVLSGGSLWADVEAVENYQFRECTARALRDFLAQVRREHAQARKDLEKKYADKPKKVDKHAVSIAYGLMETTAADLVRRAEAGESLASLERSFDRLQRLHYSTRAELEPYTDPPLAILAWKCAGNYFFGPLKLTTRRPALDRPLGEKAARLESARLCDPRTGRPVSASALAAMTPVQVSQLEPVADHPAIRPVKPGDHYQDFLKRITSLIRADSKKTKQFDLSYARRILIFDSLKDSATSPKIKAKDRYGLEWKVKWGDEVHGDVVATRLAIDLGATYVDLKFWSGPGQTLLILPKSKDPQEPTTQRGLEKALLESKYHFHLNRYILEGRSVLDERGTPLGTGRVDAAMIERESLDEKYLGCYYLAFKECQLTLDNPVLKRLGGIDLNRGRAREDRVARSAMVFNSWLNNPDVKEDNTRGGLLPDPKTGRHSRYVEFQSDMGSSFAGPVSAGCLSTLSPNCVSNVFATQHQRLHTIFLPDCWRSCTWADARWMARRIAGLKRKDLERIFADSGWPSFSQQLGVEKMLARRNDLVKAFGLTDEGYKLEPCDPKITIKVTTPAGTDTPVIRGVVNPLSKIVRELHRTTHPEGLVITRPRQLH